MAEIYVWCVDRVVEERNEAIIFGRGYLHEWWKGRSRGFGVRSYVK